MNPYFKVCIYGSINPIIIASSRAADWKLDQPDWTGRLRIVTLSGQCYIKFEDKISGRVSAISFLIDYLLFSASNFICIFKLNGKLLVYLYISCVANSFLLSEGGKPWCSLEFPKNEKRERLRGGGDNLKLIYI